MLVHNFLFDSATRTGDKIALVHGRERISYSTLAGMARRAAGRLLQQGLTTGDRVAILTDNPIHYISCYFGTLQAGGIVVGLNTQTSERTLDGTLSDCTPAFFLLSGRSKQYAQFIAAHRQKLKLQEIDLLLADDGADIPELPIPSLTQGDHAQIIYTSGTTGRPKGVILSHLNLVANTRSIISYLHLQEDDTVMAVLPFFYSYGNSVMLTHIAAGGTLVVNQSFVYPNVILEQMVNEKVTGLSGVPSTFAILIHRSAARDYNFPHLRYLTQAGAAMAPKLALQLNELFPNSDIYIMYGQTEASPRLSFLAPEDLLRKPGSIGMAIPGVTLQVLREDGTSAAPGETGEIVAQGDNIMVGYWQRPEETDLVLRGGKLWTGDLAYCDEDGFFFIVSRKSEMIKCGSHRIAPKEIEEIISEMNGIVEVAVAGREDEILGESICAYVVLQPGSPLTQKDILTFCRKHLPAYKVPHRILLLGELPKSESGKIQKEQLAQTSNGNHLPPHLHN